MAIKVIPVKKLIYLQDIDDEFCELEGADCPDAEKAWVSVRQATEGDAMEIAELRSTHMVQWIADKEGRVLPQEKREVNERLLYCNQAFRALCNAGNIFDVVIDKDGNVTETKPLFRFKDGKVDMSYPEFKEAWGKLDETGAYVILRAVYVLNPQWDWIWTPREKEGEVYKKARE